MSNAWLRKDNRLIVKDSIGIFHVLEDWEMLKPESTISGVTIERRTTC